jgi:hypothetical protein
VADPDRGELGQVAVPDRSGRCGGDDFHAGTASGRPVSDQGGAGLVEAANDDDHRPSVTAPQPSGADLCP